MSGSEGRKRIVFVGGGHAHLYGLKRAGELVARGAEVTLVAPHRHHYYSGMGPGLLSGLYRPEDARVDVEALAAAGGCAFVEDRVVGVDAAARVLRLAGGAELSYDWVSFNTGSRVPLERISGADGEAIPVKPIENMLELRARVLAGRRGEPFRVLILGGGPAGVELAGNLWRLGRAEEVRVDVTLWEAGDRLLPALPRRAADRARRSLEGRGVAVRTGRKARSLGQGKARAASGETLSYDVAVLTVGIVPHELFRLSELPVGPDGGLLVDAFLRSPKHPEVFGGGDCVRFGPKPLPRVGVYAVREGRVLFRNIRAALEGRPLEPFRPQKRYLLILNLGDGTGLATWGRWTAGGAWALRWKDRLDRSFMGRFQVSGEGAAPRTPEEKAR
ncbi:MAG: FAD-dependent oxidoreductase [Thermodesulfobacteriota bacterium]